jgi:2-methylfumaryl-CoA isomerase
VRPDLIMLVITGNRDGGPAVDYTINAALGFPAITGPENHDGPVNHVLPAWDAMTGFIAATAILAAELHRRATGEGQLVEISLADVGLAVASHMGLVAEAIVCEEPRGRFGNDLYGTYAHDFTTQDSRSIIALALTPRHWRSLVEATGLESAVAELESRLGLDLRLEGDRWQARREITALLSSWIGERDLADVRARFERHGVMWGPYQTFKQLVAEDRRASIDNPMFAEVNHPGLGTYLTTGSPIRFGAAAPVPPQPAPALGQHNQEVIREFGLES